jgi:hypothetical protein
MMTDQRRGRLRGGEDDDDERRGRATTRIIWGAWNKKGL